MRHPKAPKGNVRRKLLDIGVEKILGMKPKAQAKKSKTNRWDYVKAGTGLDQSPGSDNLGKASSHKD